MAIRQPFCAQCGYPFDPLAKGDTHCAICRDVPPYFDAARAAGYYTGALRTAIHQYKYNGVQALALPLASWAMTSLELPFRPDCLCPVPLHPRREARRGYNQSLLLAEAFSAGWKIYLQPDLLRRTVDTPPQMRLNAEERRRNIRDSFTIQSAVEGRSIGLVDDVMTTGATLNECARMLKRAGATQVLAVTLARAVPDHDIPTKRQATQ